MEYPEDVSGQQGGVFEAGASPDKMVDRKPPDPSEERKKLVKSWLDTIEEAEGYWKPVFEQMRKDMQFAKGWQWGEKSSEEVVNKYTANLVHRHIRQRVSTMYAKNPRAIASVREKMWFRLWDGDPMKISAAQEVMQAGLSGMAEPQAMANAQALLEDYSAGMSEKRKYQKIAKGLQLLFTYFMDEQKPAFKTNLKQLVARVVTCGVGYIKLGFLRKMERSPGLESRIKDFSDRIFHLERIAADLHDGETLPGDKSIEEMRLMLEQMQSDYDVIVKEGLVFDFPKATNIIPDPAMVQLKGFVGADWIAQKFIFAPKKIQELYGVDIGSNFKGYDRAGRQTRSQKKQKMAIVYQVWDMVSGQEYHVCPGYPDFLKSGDPDIRLDQFHPLFALSFNDIEDEEDVFPPSDVKLLRPMQEAYNTNRQNLREHRQGNRPAWVSAAGVLPSDDQMILASHDSNELIELEGLKPGTDIKTVLQEKPKQSVDPNLYSVEDLFVDTQRVVGAQAADFGGTSKATATEASIAEQTRMGTIGSNVDDLDDFLSAVAKASGDVLLAEMSQEQVTKILGAGAVWPEMSAQEIADDVFLSVAAGSSGRPNKAADIANLERVAPFLIQIPGINTRWLADQFLTRMDDGLDLTDAFSPGMPSIVSQNGATQPGTGNPATDPSAQGGQGGQNAPVAQGGQPGGQAAYPGLTPH